MATVNHRPTLDAPTRHVNRAVAESTRDARARHMSMTKHTTYKRSLDSHLRSPLALYSSAALFINGPLSTGLTIPAASAPKVGDNTVASSVLMSCLRTRFGSNPNGPTTHPIQPVQPWAPPHPHAFETPGRISSESLEKVFSMDGSSSAPKPKLSTSMASSHG